MLKAIWTIAAALTLAACDEQSMKTAEGCPIGLTEIGQARQAACQRIYAEERALASGGTVTQCFDTPSGMTCTTN